MNVFIACEHYFAGNPSRGIIFVGLNFTKPSLMKKSLFIIGFVLIAGSAKPQGDCSDIFISEYVDAHSNNKALELYNPTAHPILLDGQYRLIRWSNGSVTSDQDIRYVLPLTGTLGSLAVMVIVQDTLYPGQDTMMAPGLRSRATFLAPADFDSGSEGCRVAFWDGDDALSLQRLISGNWTDIDIFGDIGVRPLNFQGGTIPSGAWEDAPPYWDGQGNYLTQDQTLKRKSVVKTGINRDEMDQYGTNSFYALAEFDSLAGQEYGNLGIHVCDCGTLGMNESIESPAMAIYPNPASHGMVEISAQTELTRVELISLLGERILIEDIHGARARFELPGDLTAGIYLVKVTGINGKTSQLKLIIR